MRKKLKLSGPPNLAPEHRVSHFRSCAWITRSYMRLPQFFLKSIAKSTAYPPFLAPSSPHGSRPLLLQLPLAIYSAPYHHTLVSPLLTLPVAAHFWNRDLNNSFSLVTHQSPPILALIVTHHTLHRISGIARRGIRHRPPLMDSSAVSPISHTGFLVALPHMLPLLLGLFVVSRNHPHP